MGTLAGLVLVLGCAGVLQAFPEYIFTFPKTLEAGQETSFCLSAKNIDIENWSPGDAYDVLIYLTMKSGEEGAVNGTGVRITGITTPEFSNCPTIRAPDTPSQYRAEVTVSVEYQDVVTDVFTADNEIRVFKPDLITLIQTDKPIYKPGQTVKFRAMTMDYKLMAKDYGFSSIMIEAPNGDGMAQWKDVKTKNGFVSLEMPLIDEPLLGEWKIKAEFEQGEAKTTFKVEEYVLPKFEVTITPPPYLLPTTETIDGKVCAKYTFGKPVKGEMTMTMCLGTYHNHYWKKRNCTSLYVPKFDGCKEFYINSTLLHLKERQYWYYDPLTINATVIDETNGIELHGEVTGPRISFTILNMKFEDDSSNYYKPGFPYKGRVVVTDSDGDPAIGELVEIVAESYYHDFVWAPFVGWNSPLGHVDSERYKWSGVFETDLNGVAHFVINDVPANVGYLNLWASPFNVTNDKRYNFDSHNNTLLTTRRPEAYGTITRWYSASNSYIYIPDVDEKVTCGSQLELDVFYTTPISSTYKFQVMVKAGDRVVSTQSKEVTFDGISNFDVIAVRPDQLLTREIVTTPPPPPTTTKTTTTQEVPMKKREAEEAEPVHEELIIPEVASVLGNKEEGAVPPIDEHYQALSDQIGNFKLSVDVTHDMSPDSEVIVYYMREDKEIVAASVKFNVQPCFRNKVEMNFQEKTLLPGSEALFTLKASPSSTCFVGMVDKSINLLGGQNQITPEQVFKKVREASRPYRWGRGRWFGGGNNYCQRKYPDLMPDNHHEYYRPWYLQAVGVDASQSFKDFDLWVETDGILETRPCKRQEHIYYSMPMSLNNEGAMVGLSGPVPRTRVTSAEVAIDDSEPAGEPERIRSLFPETWLWDIYTLGNEGESTISTTIPDTITEWVGNSLCTSPDDGVGVSEMTGVTGFKPFFVTLTLPYAAVRNETLNVPVTVYNYLDKCVRLDLRVEEEETFHIKGERSKRFCLCGSETHTSNYKITPLIIGEIEILVKAVSIRDNGACSNFVMTEDYVGVSDGVQKPLLVEPEGIPQEKTVSNYMCITDEPISMTVDFDLPRETVVDSERAYVTVVGDIMGPTLSNLKNLLRMPYGCGEQNMASWAPNIYVLQYLTNTNQLTDKLEEEAQGYMRVGYQRQMKYRHSDYSYSAFGENNYNNDPGSIWLTAFVVKSMAQSSQFIPIQENDIAQSVYFIIKSQNDDGCFPQIGKVFSSYMKGGLSSGENPAGLSAFIMIALLEAGIGNITQTEYYTEGVEKGLSCLREFNPDTLDTYTLSVLAYVFSLTDDDVKTRELLDALEQRKVSESGLEYWKRESLVEQEKGYWWRYSSAEVEMTAYVAMAKLNYGMEAAVGEVQPIIQWLTKQRNPYGGFSSTQDTVIALQALAMFGSLTYSGSSDLSIRITNRRTDTSISVTEDNMLLTQTQRVEPRHGDLTIAATGTGCALVQVSTRYSIYEEEKKKIRKPFQLDQYQYPSVREPKNCAMKALRICSRYRLPGSSNMAIIEVKMQTGWEPVPESIKELQVNGIISRFEVDKNYVQLYFDELSRDKKCTVFEVKETMEVENAKEALVRVYDYYETELSVSKKYSMKSSCKPRTQTKQDIPKNNEGLDCTRVQCRVEDIPRPRPEFMPKGCPRCLDSMPDLELKQAACDAQRIYKAAVGRTGDFKVKLMTNFTARQKQAIGAFVNPEMNPGCSCPVLDYKGKKAFFFTVPQTWEYAANQDIMKLGEETLIVKQTGTTVRAINRVKSRKHLCAKMERKRRAKLQKRKNRRRNGASRSF